MATNPSPLLQRVYGTQSGVVAQSTHIPITQMTGPKLYFRLSLFSQPTIDQQGQQATPNLANALIAGQVYLMHINADPDSDDHSIHAVTMYTAIELYLESNHCLVQVEPWVVTAHPESVTNTTYKFHVKVSPFYVGDPVSLILSYRRVGRAGNLTQLARYNLHGHTAQMVQQPASHRIVLDGHLSEQVRVLHVAPRNATHYYICSYWDEKIEFSADILSLGVSLARFINNRDSPRDIINKIKAKSANNPVQFIRWVKTHLHNHGQNFCLIIHDDTDESDMAWELIHVNLQPGDCPLISTELAGPVPLGALVTMTRWVPGLHWYDIEHQLNVDESTTRGRVVAFFDHGQTLPSAQLEHNALQAFVADRYGDIQSFKSRLSDDIADTGLIYIGSHGIIVNEDLEKDFILSLDRHEEIKVYDLAAFPYLANIAARPIVIVNACHSAWLFRHEGERYGLSVALLQQIAKDFIGTIGPVGDKRAAQMAEAIFAKLQAAQSIRLAQLLRDLRADAFRHSLQSQSDDETWLDYLYTFMYVYYGNPFSRLQLTPAANTDQEGDHS